MGGTDKHGRDHIGRCRRRNIFGWSSFAGPSGEAVQAQLAGRKAAPMATPCWHMCRRQVGALALGHGADIGMRIWVVGPAAVPASAAWASPAG